ncbi:MAG TPA: hypothetical protein VEV86_07760, partial [Vicinamibacterales bacterium]|nr:hypothetical protein [Vicinamibacterales bacterium]
LPPSNSPLPIARLHLPAGHERAQAPGTSEHTCTNEGCSVTEHGLFDPASNPDVGPQPELARDPIR